MLSPCPKSGLLISVNRLCFSYQRQPILTDVSFSIAPGQFVAVIGPNGGGKTTLLRLLLGFLKPGSGTLHLFCEKNKLSSSTSISYVPQQLKLDRAFPVSVEEVVLTGLLSQLPWYGRFSTVQKQAATSALEWVGMQKWKNARFGQLSGGQAQRVLLARALVSKPELLLLDEPTASIDPEATEEIYRLLKELRGSMTIVMVTHDLKMVGPQVDRLLCVQQQVSELKPEQICNHLALGLYTHSRE